MDEGEGVPVTDSGNTDNYAGDADETMDEAEVPMGPDTDVDEPVGDEANEAKQVDAKQVKAKKAEAKSAPIPTPARGRRAAAKKSAAKPGKTNKTTSPAKPKGKFGKGKTSRVPKAKATPKKKATRKLKDDVERKLHSVSKLVYLIYSITIFYDG